MEEPGYRPNALARRLCLGQTKTMEVDGIAVISVVGFDDMPYSRRPPPWPGR